MSKDEQRTAIDHLKAWLEVFQILLTIVGLGCAGWWFFQQRSTKPVIKLEQTLTQRRVDGPRDEWLIGVDAKVTNTGKPE